MLVEFLNYKFLVCDYINCTRHAIETLNDFVITAWEAYKSPYIFSVL